MRRSAIVLTVTVVSCVLAGCALYLDLDDCRRFGTPLTTAIEAYRTTHGRYPAELEDAIPGFYAQKHENLPVSSPSRIKYERRSDERGEWFFEGGWAHTRD